MYIDIDKASASLNKTIQVQIPKSAEKLRSKFRY